MTIAPRIILSGAGKTQMVGPGVVRTTGYVQPSIQSVSLNPSNGIAQSTSGTVIGALSFSMSDGSAPSGTFTLTNSAGGDFQLLNGNQIAFLPNNVPAGSYTIGGMLTVVGAANSPQAWSQVITLAAAPTISPSTVTGFALNSTSSSPQTNVVIELAVPLPPNTHGSGLALALLGSATQADQTATNAKGTSIRFQRIAAVIPSLAANAAQSLSLTTQSGSAATGTPITPADLLACLVGGTGGDNYETLLVATMPDGSAYTASARAGLGASATYTHGQPFYAGTFRSGPYITEHIVQVPFTNAGVVHPTLMVEFHITGAKAAPGAYSDSGNPVLWTRTRAVLHNGYIFVGTPADLVYDITVQAGVTAPQTVYQLDGASVGAVTLGATSSSTKATRGSGNWSPKSYTATGPGGSDNLNDVGKALVEVGGPGLGRIVDYLNSSQIDVLIPAATAFSTTTPANTRTMGVYHSNYTRWNVPNIYQGDAPQYDVILPSAYLKQSQMIMNYASTPATFDLVTAVPKGNSTLAFAIEDGSHPCAMTWNGGRLGSFVCYEGTTGERQELGVIPFLQVNAICNWDADHANAKLIMEAVGRVGNAKSFWMRDESTGGMLGVDKAGCVLWNGNADTSTSNRFNTTQASSPWFFSLAHTAAANYAPYLVTGELMHLQNVAQLVFSDISQVSGYGILDQLPINTPSSTGDTTFVISSGATASFDTGDAVIMSHYGFTPTVTVGGSGIVIKNSIFYYRSLSSSTFSLYDSYVNAMAGGALGLVTIAGGGAIEFCNGIYRSQIYSDEIRAVAWPFRSAAQAAAIMPDNLNNLLGHGTTQAIFRKYMSVLGKYLSTNYTTNSNFTAGGPRWLKPHNYTFSVWQQNYLRLALLNAVENGVTTGTGDPIESFLDWFVADVFQWNLQPSVIPLLHDVSYYFQCTDGTTGGYDYSTLWLYEMKQAGAAGGRRTLTCTASISDVSNQSAVPVTFSDNLFNMSRVGDYVGAWISIGGNKWVKIVNVSAANACTVNGVAAADAFWPGASGAFALTAGTGQIVEADAVDPSVAVLISNSLTVANANSTYAIFSLAAHEIAKQRGIDSSNYSPSLATYTTAGFPMVATPLPTSFINLDAPTAIKSLAVSRV